MILANGKPIEMYEAKLCLQNFGTSLQLIFVGEWGPGTVSISWDQDGVEGTLAFDAIDGQPPRTLTLLGKARVSISFEAKDRQVDTCSTDALRVAVQCLQSGSGEESQRIGAVSSEILVSLLANRFGTARVFCKADLEALFRVEEISSFVSKSEGIACVAKHGGHSKQQPDIADNLVINPSLCLQKPIAIDSLVQLSCCGCVGWRSVAASFSTMMRYFQKTKEEFYWKADSCNKTIIQAF